MLHALWSSVGRGRVNPVLPALVALAGVVVALIGSRTIGLGVVVGAALAYLNGLLLSRRVDIAVSTPTVASALMVMQLSLLLTLTIIGVATAILVHVSVAMAVASAAGFAVSQIAILGSFYWSHGRQDTITETKAL